MLRRQFLIASAALALPVAGRAETLTYEVGLVDTALAAGKTVFLDYHAYWCPTCQAQKRVIDTAKERNPAYDRAITFVEIDWDQFQAESLAKRLKVYSRGTLIALKGDKELGRIVYQTNNVKIRELMDIALAAATS